MEQNLVSDELIKRINNVLNDSKEEKNVEERLENSSVEKFHDVSDSIEHPSSETGFDHKKAVNFRGKKDLELENRILASQLEAERKKSKELQSKFQLFENSVKYFERLNGQLEEIRQTVEEDSVVLNDQGDYCGKNFDGMQKLRPKTIHTAAIGNGQDEIDGDSVVNAGEPHLGDTAKDGKGYKAKRNDREEVAFRDAEDFKQLDQDSEIIKDKYGNTEFETEKVFITKTEKKCLEDIGNLASRMRTPLDDKHQRYFEKDRRRFANRIVMPETQEVERSESVPPDLAFKNKETPINITSTELDGLRSYLLQLKELIARRETAWARTTERYYNQRVEIMRFKNEVSHLRMLCEKRQKDIKERDQMLLAKDEEIKELQKRVQSLRNAVMKLEKKDDRINDTLEGITNEVLENSQIVQKSYNVMKKSSLATKAPVSKVSSGVRRTVSSTKDTARRAKTQDRSQTRKIKSTSSNSNDDEPKPVKAKSKAKVASSDKVNRTKLLTPNKKSSIERVDEKLQRIEQMLHSDVLKGDKKANWRFGSKNDRVGFAVKSPEIESGQKKLTPTGNKVRQDLLGAMTSLRGTPNSKTPPFLDPKRGQGNASILANALLAARNTNVFNF